MRQKLTGAVFQGVDEKGSVGNTEVCEYVNRCKSLYTRVPGV